LQEKKQLFVLVIYRVRISTDRPVIIAPGGELDFWVESRVRRQAINKGEKQFFAILANV